MNTISQKPEPVLAEMSPADASQLAGELKRSQLLRVFMLLLFFFFKKLKKLRDVRLISETLS